MQRRRFLAGAATACTSVLAGCSALLGASSGGSDGGYGQVARWALAPSAPDGPLTSYSIGTLDPAGALAARDGLDAEGLPASYDDSFLWRVLPARDLDRVIEVETDHRLSPDRYRIFEGDLDVDRVTAAFADAPNYDPTDLGSDGDYHCYDTGAGFFLHGVTDGRAIEIDRLYGDDLDRTAIEHVVDAGTGDAERLAERNDGVATVTDRLDPRHQSGLGVVDPERDPDPTNGTFAGVTASGASAAVREEETRVRSIQVFRDEAALDASNTEPWVEASREQEGYSELDLETDGRVLVGELTVAPGRIFVS